MARRDIPVPQRSQRFDGESEAFLHLKGELAGQRGAYATGIHAGLAEGKLAEVASAAFAPAWETLSDTARKSIESDARKQFFNLRPGKNYISDVKDYNDALQAKQGEQEFPLTIGQLNQRRGELDSTRKILENRHKTITKVQEGTTERFVVERMLIYVADATDFYTRIIQQGFIRRAGAISGTWKDYWAGRKQRRQAEKTEKVLAKQERRQAGLEGTGLLSTLKRNIVRSAGAGLFGRAVRGYYGLEGQDIRMRSALDVGQVGAISKLKDIGRSIQMGTRIATGRGAADIGLAGRAERLFPSPNVSAEVLPSVSEALTYDEMDAIPEVLPAFPGTLEEPGVTSLPTPTQGKLPLQEIVQALSMVLAGTDRPTIPAFTQGLAVPSEVLPTFSKALERTSIAALPSFPEVSPELQEILPSILSALERTGGATTPEFTQDLISLSPTKKYEEIIQPSTEKRPPLEGLLPEETGLKKVSPVMTDEVVDTLQVNIDTILEALKEGKIDRKEFKWLKDLKGTIGGGISLPSLPGGLKLPGMSGAALSTVAGGAAAAASAAIAVYMGYEEFFSKESIADPERFKRRLKGAIESPEAQMAGGIPQAQQEEQSQIYERAIRLKNERIKPEDRSFLDLTSYDREDYLEAERQVKSERALRSGAGGVRDAETTGEAGTGQGTSDMGSVKVRGGVDFQGLQPELKSKFAGMAKEYEEKFGQKLLVSSGKRSLQKQAQLYDQYGPGRAAKPNPNAPHVAGFALDASSAQMNQAANSGLLQKYGLSRPLWPSGLGRTQPEAWHVELAGMRGAGGKPDPSKISSLGEGQPETVTPPPPPDVGAKEAVLTDTSAGGVESPSLQEQALTEATSTAITTGPVEQEPAIAAIPSVAGSAQAQGRAPEGGVTTQAAALGQPAVARPSGRLFSQSTGNNNPISLPPLSFDDLAVQALRLDVVNAPFAS